MKVLDLDQIRERNEPPGFHVDQDDVRLLLAEIERLREIEDEVRAINGFAWRDPVFDKLIAVLDNNPRHKPQP